MPRKNAAVNTSSLCRTAKKFLAIIANIFLRIKNVIKVFH